MARDVQDIAVIEYNGDQGSVELETVESATLNRTKSKARVKTMNRNRQAIAFQTGTQEATVTLTVIPELLNPEVDWDLAWQNDEKFLLTFEKGDGGNRELLTGCEISDVNDTFNEAGEARKEVSIEVLVAILEPSAA